MQIIRHNDLFRKRQPRYNNVPKKAEGAVVALGNFDGIHHGHQAVLRHTIDSAKQAQKPSAILTFEPHPMQILLHRPIPLRITNFKQKFRLIQQVGIDYMYCITFDNEFSTTTAHQFVENILIKHLHVSHVIIGDDFIFGHQRSGNGAFLEDMATRHGFKFTQISPVGNQTCSDRFSSSAIRDHIKAGHIQRANAQLGHNFTIAGRVIHGHQRGRTIGVPTANIRMGNYIRPLFGVYSCQIKVAGTAYQGICNIGNKPTIGSAEDLLEVHIFEFNHDIYGQTIEVELVDFIRNEQKFANIDALKCQIYRDLAQVKSQLNHSS